MEHLLWLISVHFPLQGAPAPTSYDPSNGPYHPEHAHAHASEDVEQVEQSDPLTPAEQSRQLRDNHRARSAAQRQHYDRIEADGELEDELLNGYEEEEDAEDELIDAAPEADGARGQEEEM
ncbi:hypothetical protein CBOM_01759 [Ceraceosorus bombacis]|uniref:Uncharacterized protein n=1 Tax=Ceraceosorus bombacis TaxID=401625 RepID=A0A0P1BDC3_9BASI|nr:hypothetical protein CBOM_01759 [Ceraceosorus bombacis]